MKRVVIEDVEKYEDERFVRPVLFKGERTTSLLECWVVNDTAHLNH